VLTVLAGVTKVGAPTRKTPTMATGAAEGGSEVPFFFLFFLLFFCLVLLPRCALFLGFFFVR